MLTGDQRKNQQVWTPRVSFLPQNWADLGASIAQGLGSDVPAGHIFTISSALAVETTVSFQLLSSQRGVQAQLDWSSVWFARQTGHSPFLLT